ncbi:MAG: GNAT family N-acetyltransferase [Candidatus Woesearchaeota archaeon]
MVYTNRVLTTKDEKEWNSLIDGSCGCDVYYSCGYNKIYEQSYGKDIDDAFNGEAFMFVYGDENDYVLIPFMKRKIDLPYIENSDFYDLISVYGYNGPIVKCSNQSKKEDLIEESMASLNKYCLKNNIVSGFVRFHPMTDNYLDFKDHVNLIDERDVVYVDLTKSLDEILMSMKKKTRNQIRKAEKSGIQVYKSKDMRDLESFVDLYLGRMRAVNTGKKYFFPFEFYKNTMDFLGDDASLFIAKYDGKVIAGSFFIHRNDYAHYHFSGSDKDYWTLSPANLILWEAFKYLKEKGVKRLHLGAGNSPGDSLYHFKYGFSDDRGMFRGAGIIFNQEVYGKFVDLRRNYCKENNIEFNDKFFPAYKGYFSAGDYDKSYRLKKSTS